MSKRPLVFLAFILFLANHISAQIQLPTIFQDNMILQRDVKVKIWGTASPKEKISLQILNKKYKAVADAVGNWFISLQPVQAGGPYTIYLNGKNHIELKNILFGDVWFCSGQSNMEHQLGLHDVRYAQEVAIANDLDIRQFFVPKTTNLQAPQADIKQSKWQAAVGENVKSFSAVAYFFAKRLYADMHVPIGIINASYGGTPIEAWISETGLKDFASIIATLQQNKDTGYINKILRSVNKPILPTDAGITGKWFLPTYKPLGWRSINIPGYWEDQGVKDLNGIVWYRRELQVPVSMIGKKATLFMGRIVDADEVYINGQLVGNTGYQYPQRRYMVPAELLKAGTNTIIIKVTNENGKGGFVPDKPYYLFAGSDTIDLKGSWQYKVGAVYEPAASAPGGIAIQNQPASLYNTMVAPFIQYAIKGICWYQGESNTGKPKEYTALLQSLIKDWRARWQQGDLPFVYVQLPGFMDYNYLPTESNWAMLREAQLKALQLPATAMAVGIDLGEWNDVHPDDKKDVGDRLALAALKCAYGKNIIYSGPIFQSARIMGNKIEVAFSNIGTGLVTNDAEPPGDFAIAGADKKFVWAQATIDNNKVILRSEKVSQPVYVRYAWADNPAHANLYNKEGLPASPFRTDE